MSWTALGVSGAGPFGQGCGVVCVPVPHDCVELLDDFQALGDPPVDRVPGRNVCADAARLLVDGGLKVYDVGMQVGQKVNW